jgi:hypothetical protein
LFSRAYSFIRVFHSPGLIVLPGFWFRARD